VKGRPPRIGAGVGGGHTSPCDQRLKGVGSVDGARVGRSRDRIGHHGSVLHVRRPSSGTVVVDASVLRGPELPEPVGVRDRDALGIGRRRFRAAGAAPGRRTTATAARDRRGSEPRRPLVRPRHRVGRVHRRRARPRGPALRRTDSSRTVEASGRVAGSDCARPIPAARSTAGGGPCSRGGMAARCGAARIRTGRNETNRPSPLGPRSPTEGRSLVVTARRAS
jgi:hypothetical protein